MSANNLPARVPFARAPILDVTDPQTQRALTTVDQNFQRLERQQTGTYQPKRITFALSPYQVKATDWSLEVDATDGTVVIAVPDAARVDGLNVRIVKSDATSHQVQLVGAPGNVVISGVTNPVLPVQFAELVIDAMNGTYYARGIGSGGLVDAQYRITTEPKFRVISTGAYRIVRGAA